MKYLKKPHLPIFILFILLSGFGYSEFIKEKYTNQEKMILIKGYEQNMFLRDSYLHLSYRLEDNTKENLLIQQGDKCAVKNYSELELKLEKLREVCFETLKICFDNKITDEANEKNYSPLKINNPKVVTAFYDYIDKVSKLDTIFAKKYQDFVFENGMNDQQINDFYFDTDDYLRVFHYARFEAQLAKMHYEDAKLLTKENYYAPYGLKIEEAKVIPYLSPSRQTNAKESEYIIYESVSFPFDKTSRIIYPENITTSFDKNGFIIIPKEYRTGEQKFKIKLPVGCSRDTIMSVHIIFKEH
ncbi:hypothetical protein ACE193_07620 [Bernardetia sp. OM2101]|uniref:hypothetical protein n=1 Tax=Bernardetia sp. OM2101 TaxID=3344876 RepID=UPI0035D022E7